MAAIVMSVSERDAHAAADEARRRLYYQTKRMGSMLRELDADRREALRQKGVSFQARQAAPSMPRPRSAARQRPQSSGRPTQPVAASKAAIVATSAASRQRESATFSSSYQASSQQRTEQRTREVVSAQANEGEWRNAHTTVKVESPDLRHGKVVAPRALEGGQWATLSKAQGKSAFGTARSSGTDDYFIVRVEKDTKLADTLDHAYVAQERDAGRVPVPRAIGANGRPGSARSASSRSRRRARDIAPTVPRSQTELRGSVAARSHTGLAATTEWYGEGHRPYFVDPITAREARSHHVAAKARSRSEVNTRARVQQARAKEYRHQAARRFAQSARSQRRSATEETYDTGYRWDDAAATSSSNHYGSYLQRQRASQTPSRQARAAQLLAQSRVNHSGWMHHHALSHRASRRQLEREKQRFDTWQYDERAQSRGDAMRGQTQGAAEGARMVAARRVETRTQNGSMSARRAKEEAYVEPLMPATLGHAANPGPGHYDAPSGFGKQALSRRPSNAAYTMRPKMHGNGGYPTPGPARYLPTQASYLPDGTSGFGQQALSRRPSSPSYTMRGKLSSTEYANTVPPRSPHRRHSFSGDARRSSASALRRPQSQPQQRVATAKPGFVPDFEVVMHAVQREDIDEDDRSVDADGGGRAVEHAVAKSMFVIEACRNCDRHSHSHPHDESKYRCLSLRIKQALQAVWPAASVFINPKASGQSNGADEELELPRKGALEVSFNGQLLVSKLLTGRWPTVDDVLVFAALAMESFLAEHDIPKWTGDSSGEEEGGESDATEEGGSGPWVPNPADAAQLGIPPPNHRFPCGTAVEAKVALADGEAPVWRPGQITGVSSQDEGASFRFFSYSVMPWRGPGTVTSDSVWVKPEHVRCAPAEPFRVGQRVEFVKADGAPKRVVAIREKARLDVEVGRFCFPRRASNSGVGIWPGGFVVHRRTLKRVPQSQLDKSYSVPPYLASQPYRVGHYVAKDSPGHATHGLCGRVVVVRAGCCDVEFRPKGSPLVLKNVDLSDLKPWSCPTDFVGEHHHRVAYEVLRTLPTRVSDGHEQRAGAARVVPGGLVSVVWQGAPTPCRVLDVIGDRRSFTARLGGRVCALSMTAARPFTTRLEPGLVTRFRPSAGAASASKSVKAVEVCASSLRVQVAEVVVPDTEQEASGEPPVPSNGHAGAPDAQPARGSLKHATVMIFNKGSNSWQDGKVVAQDHDKHSVDVELSNGWVVEQVPLSNIRVMVAPAGGADDGGAATFAPAMPVTGLDAASSVQSQPTAGPGDDASIASAKTGWTESAEV